MDRVRSLIVQKTSESRTSLAALSRKLRRNHAYMQQFVKRGIPAELPEKIRPKLAELLNVEEWRLRTDDIPSDQATELGVSADRPLVTAVKVIGYVGAGQEAHFYAVAQGDLDEVAAPGDVTKNTVAAEIRGSSMGEFYNGGLVFYDDIHAPIMPNSPLIGKVCVVGLPDQRVLIKRLRRGKNGLFDLYSNNTAEEPVRDIKVEWAARVKLTVPR